MRNYLQHIKTLGLRLTLLLIVFQLTRYYFFISNYSKYSETNLGEIIWAFIVGIRFDLVSIGIFNSIFIILSILPFLFITHKTYQNILKFIFISINSILIFTNLLDSEYFKFTQKRSTFDVFDVLQTDDFNQMVGGYISTYWYVFFIGIILTFILIKFYPNIKNGRWTEKSLKFKLSQSIIILIIISISAVVIRGVDHKPITVTSAAEFANVQTVAIALNTPFTIINTFNKKGLKEKTIFQKDQLLSIYSPIKNYKKNGFRKMNIVILIMESMCKEYSHLSNPSSPGYTPFLDSLTKKSLYFRYSYANGKRSIEALPSILNSSPSLMDRPYISSPYAANKTEGLAEILKKEGYYTSFMHGGANGTMYFDKFCYMSGFKDYYGKNEYPNDKDYDGNWGIYDEPYLQYAVKKMSEFKEPFFNTIFTLSSHHPYSIPKKYKNKFPKGTLEIHETVGYVDFSLKEFFESAAKEDWFKNTLFVLTADHTSISETYYFQNAIGSYAVPIIFYQANDSSLIGESSNLMQHIDIMPSILDYLHYNKPFYAIGNSGFDSTQTDFVINHITDRYYYTNKNSYNVFFGDSIHRIFKLPKDSLLKYNIIKNRGILKRYKHETDTLFKAIIQIYNNDLIHNRTYAESDYYSK